LEIAPLNLNLRDRSTGLDLSSRKALLSRQGNCEDVVVIGETPNVALGTARRKGFVQIMQRDGDLFFWPESEEE
jgi:hypothetical protein